MEATLWMVRRKFATVQQMQTDEFATKKEQAIVFDVRKKEEYDISRIEGSTWVPPKDTDRVQEVLKEKNYTPGTPVVFYCSLGYRSSQLAEMTETREAQEGDVAVDSHDLYNLEGSIFKWAIEGYPIVNNNGATKFVHPYNTVFGMILPSKMRRTTLPKE
eukprot:m.137729 g.137729  ORF g.137729 m.137729 type:complete len:160 (+) comp12235_c0_seq1:12-491(+)